MRPESRASWSGFHKSDIVGASLYPTRKSVIGKNRMNRRHFIEKTESSRAYQSVGRWRNERGAGGAIWYGGGQPSLLYLKSLY